MDERRYLFVTWDGGGNLPPIIALARQLAREGNFVAVFGPESQRERVEEVGATLVPCAPLGVDLAETDLQAHFDAMTTHLTSTAMARDILRAITETAAQVALVDCMHFAGLAAVEKADIAAAVFAHTRFGFFTEDARTEIDSWMRDPVSAVRSDLRLPPLTDESVPRQLWDRCDTVLSMLVPALESPVEHKARNLVHIGPIYDEPVEAVEPTDPAPEPLLVVSFSTTQMGQGAVIQNVLDAVDGLDARVVCTTGGVPVGDLRVPANAELAGWVSHTDLFSRASLAITHVGMGTALAALTHGVPIVGMPMGRDQDGNARLVADIGAGVHLAPTASPNEIRAAIDAVLADNGFATAARTVARDISQFENGTLARSALGWL